MWYITFHGGDDGVNNVHAYDDNGELVVKHLLPKDPPLRELRGIAFGPDGHLYIVNGYKKYSQILRYEGTPREDGSHEFIDVFASKDTVDALVHPFSLAFDSHGHCYASSQDTNVVTRLWYTTRKIRMVAPYLARTYPNNQLLGGTFVASSEGHLPDVPTAKPNVGPPQGLEVSLDSGNVSHSVRDILVHGDRLFVADEPGNAVKIYDGETGKLVNQVVDDKLAAPVHLLSRDGVLYVGSTGTNSVLKYDIASGVLSEFVEGIESVSGMSFGGDDCFYAASRKEQCILKYDESGNFIDKFIKGLPDNPEFLLYSWPT
jgi:hypothetical protein